MGHWKWSVEHKIVNIGTKITISIFYMGSKLKLLRLNFGSWGGMGGCLKIKIGIIGTKVNISTMGRNFDLG